MASIVSSVLTLNDVQQDGRRVVIETHTDDAGNQYQISYMAEADIDPDIKLAQHASDLNNQLSDQVVSDGA